MTELYESQNSDFMNPETVPSRLTFDGPKGPLFKAMAEARKHFKPLTKTDEVEVQGKEGKRGYTFQYAPLDVVIASLEPGWQAAGIAVIQPFDGDNLYTIVACGDSSMTVTMPLPSWTSPQILGSVLTYLKRYMIKGVFCVNDAEDDDGNAASGNQGTFKKREPQAAPKAQASAIPKPLYDEVIAAAKANELPKAAFDKLVYEQTGNAWKDCDEADARKLLGVLKP